MTSFLVIATDEIKRDEYIKHFCNQQNIDPFDQTTLTLETSIKQNTQSIGIEDIKHMQKKIFLKPIKSAFKAIIIEDAQLLTTEAQNALLKILEEPPEHTIIILSSETKETLLPTILSRCQLIQLEEQQRELSAKEREEIETFLANLPELGIGERLKKAEILAKEKDKAIEYITKLIVVSREKLLSQIIHPELVSGSSDTLDTLKQFQSLHTLLKTTNVNPRFAIENTLLQLTSPNE
ncbi:MAG TPA: hypothetical protein VLF20_02325 [Patescibacteria group bacterium]|nr:hypothetical protein [Patescibacteria group bacterium]